MKKVTLLSATIFTGLLLISSCRKETAANTNSIGVSVSFSGFDFSSFKEITVYRGPSPANAADSAKLSLSDDKKIFINKDLLNTTQDIWLVNAQQNVNERIIVSYYFYQLSQNTGNNSESISILFTHKGIPYTIDNGNRIASITVVK